MPHEYKSKYIIDNNMSTESHNNQQEGWKKDQAHKSENNHIHEESKAEKEAPKEQQPEEKTIDKQLEEAKATIEEQKDKYLRLSAEFDNYRKRTLKEKSELIKNGGEKAISAILPILDDLERALQNMEKAEDVAAIHKGIELIHQKFLKALAQEGLSEIRPIGEAFDTDYHEAIAMVPAQEEKQKGKVLDCVQTGYKLHDKVIRHAKVVVAQ